MDKLQKRLIVAYQEQALKSAASEPKSEEEAQVDAQINRLRKMVQMRDEQLLRDALHKEKVRSMKSKLHQN